MHTMILCLGHECLWGDDVVARVGRILRTLPLPAPTTVRVAAGLDWVSMEALVGHDQLMVVDAMTNSGYESGTCCVEEPSGPHIPTFQRYCRHREVVKEIVELSNLFARKRRQNRLVFVGVEIGTTPLEETFSLSDLRSTVPLTVDSVLRSLGAEAELRRMVPRACARADSEDLTDLMSVSTSARLFDRAV